MIWKALQQNIDQYAADTCLNGENDELKESPLTHCLCDAFKPHGQDEFRDPVDCSLCQQPKERLLLWWRTPPSAGRLSGTAVRGREPGRGLVGLSALRTATTGDRLRLQAGYSVPGNDSRCSQTIKRRGNTKPKQEIRGCRRWRVARRETGRTMMKMPLRLSPFPIRPFSARRCCRYRPTIIPDRITPSLPLPLSISSPHLKNSECNGPSWP